jgi:enoyl-CoA hydratase
VADHLTAGRSWLSAPSMALSMRRRTARRVWVAARLSTIEVQACAAMSSGVAVRQEDEGAVRRLVLCRPEAYNTITPALRDELGNALDAADRDHDVRVVLLSAEGPAFCAGFGLDWSTAPPTRSEAAERAWDTVADVQMIGSFGRTFAKLHEISKPTVAAVQGWCIAGGTDMVLNADLIVAGEGARFGYPPARVWGVPEAPWLWVARLGLERAKRYLFTGDELTASEAAEAGMVLECVPNDQLHERSTDLAQRIARLPLNQLQMIKWMLNDVARHQYQPDTSRLLGFIFDGVARHTQEGLDFVARAQEVGWRQAVRDRDRPFGDYGERAPSGRGGGSVGDGPARSG